MDPPLTKLEKYAAIILIALFGPIALWYVLRLFGAV